MKLYSKPRLVALLCILSCVLTFIVYHLLTHIAYYPGEGAITGREVFLLPRYFLRQNDLETEIFRQWGPLALLLFLLPALSAIGFHLCDPRRLSFSRFLAFAYVLALSAEFAFLFLTPMGFTHIEKQVISINNGIWLGLHSLQKLALSQGWSSLEFLQYIYRGLGCNNCGYTLPGTTHPPGLFVIGLGILKISQTAANPALAWGLLITLFNSALVPLAGLIARQLYSERRARNICIMLLGTPSLCLHFSAVLEGIASVALAAAFLLTLMALVKLNRVQTQSKSNLPWFFLVGTAIGVFYTAAAQISYGFAIPIAAFLFASSYFLRRGPLNYLAAFLIGIAVPALSYFAFEFLISDGQAFWITRAMNITKFVKNTLSGAGRPYAVSQIANFVVMSVTGGLFWLPGALLAILFSFRFLKSGALRARSELSNQARGRAVWALAASFMLVFALLQSTVRLEVERTWHWLFLPAWIMAAAIFPSIEKITQRNFGKDFSPRFGVLAVFLLQIMISLVLAMTVQDYY